MRFAIPVLVALLLPLAAHADDGYQFRLSPGPRLVGTRADSSGSGTVTVALKGNSLSLSGSYHGLLGAPTAARLLMGTAPGVRGPKIADLTITDGALSGTVKLNTKQLAAYKAGGLYVEIDSASAPDGDLWGWVMPPAQ